MVKEVNGRLKHASLLQAAGRTAMHDAALATARCPPYVMRAAGSWSRACIREMIERLLQSVAACREDCHEHGGRMRGAVAC